MSGDPYQMFDGAYVLGALSPQDRAAFEEHMGDCDACARSVRELAGLPGLLAQAEMAVGPPPPPTLLPAMLDEAAGEARSRAATAATAAAGVRRRRRLFAAVAATAVTLAACLALAFTAVRLDDEGPASSAMTPVGAYPVSATLRLADADGGTRVEMECEYGGERGGDYLLVAVGRDGGTEVLARWYALPRNSASLSVGTALRRADIESLEVRTPSGATVLRLTP
ncbi:anti-sigma factor family protein [Streptomyces sp. SBT349]|uniref:anti-sigma factor family protein n=1 Tax=Streptomyces sp. SBT349 TaxID=1580539 RepID=UPI00066E5738|nr:zf-HC2 domain-containing protein [Streptomyces sp. SBT349]